jgi:hypothetical protein
MGLILCQTVLRRVDGKRTLLLANSFNSILSPK